MGKHAAVMSDWQKQRDDYQKFYDTATTGSRWRTSTVGVTATCGALLWTRPLNSSPKRKGATHPVTSFCEVHGNRTCN